MVKFVVKNRQTQSEQVYQLRQNVILIGRSSNCDVTLNSESVSRHHAQILLHQDQVQMEDLGSINGTLINEKKITPHKKTSLESKDKIRIEEFEISFDAKTFPKVDVISAEKIKLAEGISKNADVTDPDILEMKMIKKILSAFDHDKRPCLFIVSEPFSELKSYIEEDMTEFIIGREKDAQLAIDSPMMSRHHAKITPKWGGFVLTDLDSKNKTYVNGEEITEKTIHDGDEILFGTIKAIFRNPLEFNLENISRSIKESEEEATKISAKKTKNQKKPVRSIPSDIAKLTVEEDKEEKKEIQETKEDLSLPDKKAQPLKMSELFKHLSPSERVLLGFGLLILIAILVGFLLLL